MPSTQPQPTSHLRTSSYPPRPPTRTRAGATEGKAIRRAEIERRCAELSPPISPALLEHMDSFQASMQIPMPLTDEAWHLLKPKLMSQRKFAEQRARESHAAAEALRPSREQSADMNDPEKIKERWETFQRPIRKDLGDYVDELVRTSWADGRAINEHTAPRFAAEALVFARNRYATDKPKSNQAGSAFRLVLHNMRWLFENKVKPLTETTHNVKELFRCAGCGHDSKTYAFDSLIQHYAAKHTNNFSSGNTHVAWFEASWPDDPPFQTVSEHDARQKILKTPFAPLQVGPVTSPQNTTSHPLESQDDPTRQIFYQPRPYPYGFPPTSPGMTGPFPSQPTPIYEYHSQAASPFFYGYSAPPRHGYTGPTSPFDSISSPFAGHPQTASPAFPNWSSTPAQVSHQPSYAPSPMPNTHPSFQQMQMDELATISREVWDALFHVKQIPPSVRLFTIVQHAVTKFSKRFSNEPNADLFLQCLVSHPLMQPMKDANGLACKVCVEEKESREEDRTHAFPLVGGERKLYSFNSLLTHFKNVHFQTKLALENAQTHDDPEDLKRLDWKTDMIELPEDSIISGLKNLSGMTDARRLAIFRETFPEQFKEAVPRTADSVNTSSIPQTGNQISGYNSWTGSLQTSPTDQQSGQDSMDLLAAHGVIKIEPGMPVPGSLTYPPASSSIEEEYDPRRPSAGSNRAHGQFARNRRSFRGRVSLLNDCHALSSAFKQLTR